MRLTTELSQFVDNRVYNYHLPISADFGQQFIDGTNRRITCLFVKQNISIQTSLMPYPEGYFILMNQKLVNQLNISTGDKVIIDIEKDDSEFGMPVPDELVVVFEQEPEAFEFFNQLTDGKKRNLIYIVNKVKNTDSRLNKSLAIVDHLKDVNGKLDFKMLGQKIKEYNQRDRLRL